MPRDYDDDRPRRRRAARPFPWLWVLGAGGVLIAGWCVITVALSLWFSGRPSSGPLTRDQFREKVEGKTEAEVIAAVGRPNSTSDDGRGWTYWYYRNVTVDPISGKVDASIQVTLFGGRVQSVRY